MGLKSSWILGALLPLALAAAAQAGTITYTSVSTPATVGFASQNTEVTTNLIIPKWDPSLFPGQTLTSVSVTINAGINGSITLTNNTAQTQTGSASTLMTPTLKDSLNNVIALSPSNVSYTTGSQSISAGATVPFTSLSNTGFLTGTQTSNLGQYTGAGTLNLPYSTATSLNVSFGGGNVGAQQATQTSATLSVTYTYSPTPEPASLGMLGLGALGLLARRARRA